MEDIKLSGSVECGFYWNQKTKERFDNPLCLEQYGYKVYSQNDEDGIIHEIFRRIGTTNKVFVEFGIQNGLESNCHLLLHYGWSGLWIEGSKEYCMDATMRFRPVICDEKLNIVQSFITKENINQIICEAGIAGEIDLLSVDIDGNDYHVWDSISIISPRVVIVEYNGKFPPDLEWVQAYNPDHLWDGSDWHGASLKSFEKLGTKKGYQLVGTNVRGCNAFFVKKELVQNHFFEPGIAENLYNPLRMDLEFKSYHPSKYCLVSQKEYLGILNYTSYDISDGFYGIESDGDECYAWMSKRISHIRILAPKGADKIILPYRLPSEIVEQGSYHLAGRINNSENLEWQLSDTHGEITIKIEIPIIEDAIVQIEFMVEKMWIPKQVMNSEDSRFLGVCFVLSEIRFS